MQLKQINRIVRRRNLRNSLDFPKVDLNRRRLKKRKKLRSSLAVLSLLILLVILGYAIRIAYVTSGPHYVLGSRPFNDLTEAAIDIRLDQARNMFQIGLAIIVALWGLLIARKEEALLVSEDWQELCMSISAAFLLGGSSVYHLLYMNKLTDLYKSAGIVAGRKLEDKAHVIDKYIIKNDSTIIKQDSNIDEMTNIPDIFDLGVNYLFVAQSSFLAAGIAVAILAFISAHKLK